MTEDNYEQPPVDMPGEAASAQPFFDAIHENIDVTRVSPKLLRKAAKACLALAEEMVAEKEKVIEHFSIKNKKLCVALHDLKKERETYDEAINGADAELNRLREENQKLSACIDRLTAECLAHIDEKARIAAENKRLEDELKRAEKIYSSAMEASEKELSETRSIYNRMASEFEVAKRDAAHYRTRTATAEEHARKLYDVIESLASIGRNL